LPPSPHPPSLLPLAHPTLTLILPQTYYYLDGGRYEGEWVDDRIHGKGKSVYSNGNVYDGEWTDGRINGYGTLTYQDGDKYIGQWVEGKMNGQGTYIYQDGDKYEVRGASSSRLVAAVAAALHSPRHHPHPPHTRPPSSRASGATTSATARAQ